MDSITKLELKKITSSKFVKISLALIAVYMIVALVGSVCVVEYKTVDNSTNKLITLKGMEAIKQKKIDSEKIKGYIDENYIKEIINNYNKIKDNEERAKYWLPYSDISRLLKISYSPVNTITPDVLNNLSYDDADKFYKNRVKQVNDSLNVYYPNFKFDESSISEITKKSEQLEKPIYYEYADGWLKIMDNLPFLNILIILVLSFCLCRIFTEDIENRMILVVLPTIYGKKKLAISKIKASIIFATVTYLALNFIFAACILLFYGCKGWNCPIQISTRYWLSIYNLKIYEVYLQSIIVGLIACLFTVIVTLLLGTILKKSVLTISAIGAFTLLPLLINTDKLSNVLSGFVGILPINIIDYLETLKKPYMYNIFGVEILNGYVTPVVLLIIFIMVIPLVIRIYNNQEA